MLNCGDCGFADHSRQRCSVLGTKLGDSRCPYYQKEIVNCAICGKIIPQNPIWRKSKEGKYITICSQCTPLIGTCRFCETGATCSFETEPIDIPKYIVETVQNGPVTQQIQKKNPLRIRETCQKSCKCFSEKFGCMRENTICENYKENL